MLACFLLVSVLVLLLGAEFEGFRVSVLGNFVSDVARKMFFLGAASARVAVGQYGAHLLFRCSRGLWNLSHLGVGIDTPSKMFHSEVVVV